jgi:phosphatidylglycerol:prolipoprotein diacylglycerol transferase
MFASLFEIGPFTLYSLWLAVSIAFVLGTLLFLKKAKYERLNMEFLLDHLFSLMLAAILVSRIAFFFTNWGYWGPFQINSFFKQIVYFWQPGYSFWGAVLGFSLLFAWHATRAKEPILPWLNTALTPLFIGIMVGNLGQLMDGQGYGRETSMPWGIQFESTNVKYTVPVHPTQLYSFLLIAAILFTRKAVQEKWPALRHETHWTLFALTVYSFGRFVIECFRGDDTLEWGFVRIGHVTATIAFVLFGSLLKTRAKASVPPNVQTETK